MITYLLIAVATLIFFIYYLGFNLPDKSATILIIRKRLSAYDGGRYALFITSYPGEKLYEQTVLMVLLASILWPIELLALIWVKIKRFF